MVLLLAISEMLAALAFLIEPIEIAACAMLLLVFVAATALSIALADYLAPLRFIFFAVAAAYIVAARRMITAPACDHS
jgi:hypothetical protein